MYNRSGSRNDWLSELVLPAMDTPLSPPTNTSYPQAPNNIFEYFNDQFLGPLPPNATFICNERFEMDTSIAYDAAYSDLPYIDTSQGAQGANNNYTHPEPNNIFEYYNNQLDVDVSNESRGSKATITSSQPPPKSIYTYVDQVTVYSLDDLANVENCGAYNDLIATTVDIGYIHDVDFRATGSLP